MPWSARPNCPAPASTPHRLTHTGKPKAEPYSSASCSLASLVAPYRETGGSVEKVSSIPLAVRPAGSGPSSSARTRRSPPARGTPASGCIAYTRLVLSITRAARCARQYSSTLIVPTRLCSTSWRLEVRPSRPARTLGFAAASTTTSAAGRLLEVRRETDVGVVEGNAEGANRGAIPLAAGPDKIVETGDLVSGRARPIGESASTDETAGASDQDLSRAKLPLPRFDDLRDRLFEPRP